VFARQVLTHGPSSKLVLKKKYLETKASLQDIVKRCKRKFFQTTDEDKAVSCVGPVNKPVPPRFVLCWGEGHHLTVPASCHICASLTRVSVCLPHSCGNCGLQAEAVARPHSWEMKLRLKPRSAGR
jgi:hypothetical protein